MIQTSARRGFTYAETVMSLAITTVLLLGLSSVLLIGSKAIPTGSEQIVTEASIQGEMDAIRADLELATEFLVLSANSFQVVVPDRDGDGSPETVIYSLSETKAVKRQWNSEPTVIAIEGVSAFSVSVQKSATKTLSAAISFNIPSMTRPEQAMQVELFNLPEVQ